MIDAAGAPASSYATGSTAYLRVEDQAANDPAVLENHEQLPGFLMERFRGKAAFDEGFFQIR